MCMYMYMYIYVYIYMIIYTDIPRGSMCAEIAP